MSRKMFKGTFYAKFLDNLKGPSIGLEWSSRRCHASFQPGMVIVATSYMRHDKRGKGWLEISIIGNNGRNVVATVEMRIVSGIFGQGSNGRPMKIVDVEGYTPASPQPIERSKNVQKGQESTAQGRPILGSRAE